MKIALCLSGYFKNSGGLRDSIAGKQYIDRKILSKYDTDVFIHSWDLENQKKVKDLYKPTSSTFEEQLSFQDELELLNEEYFFGKHGAYYSNSMFKTLSVSYSRKMSIDLKSQYEKDNGFEYDCVIMTRFDLGQRGKEYPQKYYATNFNFNPSLNMEYLYSAYWDQFNHGFPDHWFFSNSENMAKVASLHDKLSEYYGKNSEYINRVTTGWPDSDANNEFSNELFSTIKSKNLKKWPINGCIDNHKLYKWHFINTGLYEKCHFIDITEDR